MKNTERRTATGAAEPQQRTALVPAFLAIMSLLVGLLFLDAEAFIAIRFLVAILALIVAWYALQARQWWWAPLFVAVALLWNPAFPFEFTGPIWVAAQYIAILLFGFAGFLIKRPPATPTAARGGVQ